MVKLKTEHQYKWGQTNVLPLVGEVKISNEGFIEVSEEVAQQLHDMDFGFYIQLEKVPTADPIKPNTESTELTKTEVDELGGSEDEEDNESSKIEGSSEETTVELTEEQKELYAELESLTVPQLKEQAAAFPAAEWRTLNKAGLVEYLKSKLV